MYSGFIAAKYIRSNKGSGFTSLAIWLSFFAIAIGVAAIIIVTSVMDGFRVDLLDKYESANGHIKVEAASGGGIANYRDLSGKLSAVRNVVHAIPIVDQGAFAINGGSTHSVMVYGISRDDLLRKRFLSDAITQEAADRFTDHVLIGSKLAKSLRVSVGDDITLFIPNAIKTPFGPAPRESTFVVGGVFDTGLYEYDANCIVMPMNLMQDFLEIGDTARYIEILTTSTKKISEVVGGVAVSAAGESIRIFTFLHSESGVFKVLQVQKNIMSLILFIIIFVAAFNIISSLTMLSNSKARDIAVLRTIGATRGAIMRAFLLIGSIIGACGSLVGAICGVVISRNISAIQSWLEGVIGAEKVEYKQLTLPPNR